MTAAEQPINIPETLVSSTLGATRADLSSSSPGILYVSGESTKQILELLLLRPKHPS